MERVAKRLRRWTQDLGAKGSIPASLVMCKKPWASFDPHRPCPSSFNGYLVERKFYCENGKMRRKFRSILPREMRPRALVALYFVK